jgi:hypothetical protein
MKPANLILIATISMLFTMMLSSCKPKQTTITGQVFVAAGVGLSIRLGAVQVLLIERREATNYLQKIETEIIDKSKLDSAAALQSHQQDIKNAQSEMIKAQYDLADEQQKFTLAQANFNEEKIKHDAFVASAPFLTNAVYVRIKRDLELRMEAISSKQQTIKSEEDEVSGTSHPGISEWVPTGNGHGWLKSGDESERIQMNTTYKSMLITAKQDLENNYEQIQADTEALQRIEENFDGFQATKFSGEQLAFNEENERLETAKSMLSSKEFYLKSLESQNPNLPHIPDSKDWLSDFSPPPILKVNTDADGNFSIVCPTSGRFSIFAITQRTEDGEKYCWLIDAPNQSIPARVLLNNNNLVEIDPDGYFKP